MDRRFFLLSLLAIPSSLKKLCGLQIDKPVELVEEQRYFKPVEGAVLRILPNLREPGAGLRIVEPMRVYECCGFTAEPVAEWFAPAGLDRKPSYQGMMNFIKGFSMKDLAPGDLFRLWEPDGTPVADGMIFKAIGEPFCVEGIWGVAVDVKEKATEKTTA